MTNMRIDTINLPLFQKFGVGFESLFDELVQTSRQSSTYPPYDMIKHSDTEYSIQLAVAGFKKGQISIKTEFNQLTITGDQNMGVTDTNVDEKSTDKIEYLHHGISRRAFTRTFTLAENVQVVGASSEDGILTVNLVKVIPESQLPKTIDITYTA